MNGKAGCRPKNFAYKQGFLRTGSKYAVREWLAFLVYSRQLYYKARGHSLRFLYIVRANIIAFLLQITDTFLLRAIIYIYYYMQCGCLLPRRAIYNLIFYLLNVGGAILKARFMSYLCTIIHIYVHLWFLIYNPY